MTINIDLGTEFAIKLAIEFYLKEKGFDNTTLQLTISRIFEDKDMQFHWIKKGLNLTQICPITIAGRKDGT